MTAPADVELAGVTEISCAESKLKGMNMVSSSPIKRSFISNSIFKLRKGDKLDEAGREDRPWNAGTILTRFDAYA